MASKPQQRRTSYAQAMEMSWPRGRYLVGLMEGLSTSKREKVTLKALREAREQLESEIAGLEARRAKLEEEIRAQCGHPPDLLNVEEARFPAEAGHPARVRYLVECMGCLTILRHREKNE